MTEEHVPSTVDKETLQPGQSCAVAAPSTPFRLSQHGIFHRLSIKPEPCTCRGDAFPGP